MLTPVLQTLEQAGEAVFNAFHQSHGIKRPQLLLVLLPSNHPECRRQVKHWRDVTRKVTTQCLVRTVSRSHLPTHMAPSDVLASAAGNGMPTWMKARKINTATT